LGFSILGGYTQIYCSKFHAKFSQAGYALGDEFRKMLPGVAVITPAWKSKPGRDGGFTQ
jgi:hypothetical protein